jgi:Uma2 family endonuclease
MAGAMRSSKGELYEMPAASWDHAVTIMNLILLLAPVAQALGGRVLTAPLDVFFASADPVQPDIVVLLPDSVAIGAGRGVEGAPDLLIEVFSPTNRGHDLLTKRALYARAGVREYWIVDPESQAVVVLTLDRDALHTVQRASGDDKVISSLLGDAAFPLAAIFAGVSEIEG